MAMIPARQRQIMAARPNVRRGGLPPGASTLPARGGTRPGDAAAGARGQTGRPGRGRPGRFGKAVSPWDSQAEREQSEAGFEKAQTTADLAGERQAQEEQSGLGPAGADNPYSDAAMLKRQRESSSRGQLNTAGNQLYAGSTINAQRGIQSAYDQSYNQLTATDAQQAAANARGVNTANREYELGLAKIKEGAYNRALETEPAPLAVGSRGGRRGRVVRRGGTPRNLPARLPSTMAAISGLYRKG
jgi:hypothetical protein